MPTVHLRRHAATKARNKWQEYAPGTRAAPAPATHTPTPTIHRKRMRHDGQLRLHNTEYTAMITWGSQASPHDAG